MRKITSLLILVSTFNFAQSPFYLNFIPKVEDINYQLNEVVNSKSGKKMELDYFNYYISNLHIFHNGGQDLDLSDTVFLVKNDNYSLSLGNLNLTNVDKISFGVGVPFELNHLDISLYPANHPLSYQDPSMQWGWTSGYNQMIVGGMADGDSDNIPESYFEIHSLGDQNYHLVEVYVHEEINGNGENNLNVFCNIDTWLGLTNLAITGIRHGENGINATIMQAPTNSPVFSSDYSYLKLKEFEKIGNVNYQKNGNSIEINWSQMVNLNRVELVNSNGQLIGSRNTNIPSSQITFNKLNSGIYFFRCYSAKDELIHQIKIMY